MTAAAVATWEAAGRATTALGQTARRGGRRAVGATSHVGRRVSSEVADDARAVAATAVAAQRRLRPEPQIDTGVDGADYEVEALYAGTDDDAEDPDGNRSGVPVSPPIGDHGAPATETAVLAAVSTTATNAGARRGNGAGAADADEADTLVTAQNREATAETTAVLPDDPAAAETTAVLPDDPATADTTAAVSHAPAAADVTRVPPGDPRPSRARRRDGIVVPLRVPLRLRLRAATGLVFMVVLLGIVAAAVVVALVLAGAQLLSNF